MAHGWYLGLPQYRLTQKTNEGMDRFQSSHVNSLMPSSLVTLFRYQWGSLKLRTTSSEWNCLEARKLAQAFSPDTFQQIDIMLAIVGAVNTSLDNGCLAPESFNWQAGFSPHIKLTCQKHRKSWHFRTSEITRHQQLSPLPSSKYLAHLGRSL